MTSVRQIVGLGGGGFAMEPDNPLLDDFVLSLARRTPAKLCFVPTASGDSANFLVRFYRAFQGRAALDDLTLIGSAQLPRHPAQTSELEAFVLEQDVLYVGGGNTANMLALWRAHGLDRILHRAWEQGIVLAGLSAGLICWFEASLSDSFGQSAALHDGLGLLSGSACPHYDGEPARRELYRVLVAAGFPEGYGVDDGAALHFEGTGLSQVVTSRPQARAYRLTRTTAGISEEPLPTRYLGAP
jgi:dipeptidase E